MALPVAVPIALYGLKFLSDLGFGIHSANKRSQQIKHQEKFRQALQDIQVEGLASVYARKEYTSSIAENVALGRQSASLAKSRIGLGGTAMPAMATIMGNYQRQRSNYYFEMKEQIAKIAAQRKSSEIAAKNSYDLGSVVQTAINSGLESAGQMWKIANDPDLNPKGGSGGGGGTNYYDPGRTQGSPQESYTTEWSAQDWWDRQG